MLSLCIFVPVLSLIWVHLSSWVYGDADPGFAEFRGVGMKVWVTTAVRAP